MQPLLSRARQLREPGTVPPATCDRSGLRPTMPQLRAALGVLPAPRASTVLHTGEAGQGQREGREPLLPHGMLVPELFFLLQQGQLLCWDRGHSSLAATRISDTGGRQRLQMGCAGADVSHLVEPTALRRMDNAVVTEIGYVQTAIHI